MLPHLKNRFQTSQPENLNYYATGNIKPIDNDANPANKMTNNTSPNNQFNAPQSDSQSNNNYQQDQSQLNKPSPRQPFQKPGGTTNKQSSTFNSVDNNPSNSQASLAQKSTTSTHQDTAKKSKSSKIDPDKIPRPDLEPQTSYEPKKFQTSLKLNPPSSFTNYITIDDGNAGPRFIRSSFYKVPTESSILNSTNIPFGIILQPLADPLAGEEAVPVVDYGDLGPFRCTRCKSYVNSFWLFTDAGNTATCNLCHMNNKVPKEYYAPLNEFGHRKDKQEKPELYKGVYEFTAPQDYHIRTLVTPHIVICLDVSSASFVNGIFNQMLLSLQSLLDYIPAPENTKIAIITYDTNINYFRVPETLEKEIQVICACDLEDPCLPYSKDQFFLRLIEDREKIDFLIQRIMKYYENFDKLSKGIYATCFGAALNNSMALLLEQGGRCIISTTQAPIHGTGKIKRRDDYKIYGTDKEKTLFVPQIEDYEKIGRFCLEKRIGVDLFVFAQEYFDLATIGQVSNITGGNIYYYPTYNSTFDGEKLHYDMSRNLTRYIGYDAVMKVRTSQGINITEYITASGRRPLPDMEFSTIDSDTALNIYFKIDEKIIDSDSYIQAAILYTNQYGQRVIRVINLAIGTSNDLITIFRCTDVEACSQLMLRKNFPNISTVNVNTIRENIISLVVSILHSYRLNCANTSSPAQLILPESLKLLPLYSHSVLKMNILRLGNDIRPDDRSYDLHGLTKLPLNILSSLLYMKIYPIHTIYNNNDQYSPGNVIDDKVILGSTIGCTEDKIESNGIYLCDNNDIIYIYVKNGVDTNIVQDLFGVNTIGDVATLQSFPTTIQTDFAVKINNIIEQLRRNKNGSYQPVRIITESDPLEPYFLSLLVEDKSKLGESYGDFLCNVHRLIQQKYN